MNKFFQELTKIYSDRTYSYSSELKDFRVFIKGVSNPFNDNIKEWILCVKQVGTVYTLNIFQKRKSGFKKFDHLSILINKENAVMMIDGNIKKLQRTC